MTKSIWRDLWESGKTSSEREWSKKYVHGLLAGFPGGTLFSAAILRSCGVAVGKGALSTNGIFFRLLCAEVLEKPVVLEQSLLEKWGTHRG
jgi:hypothetical protein